MSIAAAAGAASQSVRQILAEREEKRLQDALAARQAEQMALQQQQELRLSQGQRADEEYRTGQVERQKKLDLRQIDQDQRDENARGLDLMAKEAALQPAPRKLMGPLKVRGAGGRPVMQQFEEGDPRLMSGEVQAYEEPRAGGGSQQSPEWVKTKTGELVKRIPQAGDVPHDAVAARQSAPADPAEARQITQTALDQAKRLYDPTTKQAHPGIDAATGAYELRGFTQPAVDFNSIRNQLVAALALPNLGALKGPMSDKDILFVKQLATRLENPRLSRQETELAISEAVQFLGSKLGPDAAQPTPAGGGHGAGGGAGPAGVGVQRWGRDANGRPVRLP